MYRAGHRAPGVDARYMAAVKACGKEAVLSGLAAAHLFGLVKGPVPRPEVTAPTERCVKGVRTRRRRIDDRDRAVWHRIPVTTVARTLVDLASLLSLDELARACHEAGVRTGRPRPRGDQHRRYTYNDVTEDPAQMLAELHALLAPA